MRLSTEDSINGEALFKSWIREQLQSITNATKKRYRLEMIINTLRKIYCQLTASSQLTARQLQSLMPSPLIFSGMLQIHQAWDQKKTAAYQVIAMQCYRVMAVTSFQLYIQAVELYQPLFLKVNNFFSQSYIDNRKQHIGDATSRYQALMAATKSTEVSLLCSRLSRCINSDFFSQYRPSDEKMIQSYLASKKELPEMLLIIKTNSNFFV